MILVLVWSSACGIEPSSDERASKASGSEEPFEDVVEEDPTSDQTVETQESRPKTSTDYLAEVEEMVSRSTTSRPLNGDELRRFKQSTVLVGTKWGSGSGFLFAHRSLSSTLVATNRHVVEDPRGRLAEEIGVVLDSGTSGSKVKKARLVGADKNRDLALLQIIGLPRNQASFELTTTGFPFETQPVVLAGYPFGLLLSARTFPEPTITTGAVSSLRYGTSGRLLSVQLDADVNQGNSGGPVVDYEGNVVGIAVATIDTTNISFMIPALALEEFVDGTLRRVELEWKAGSGIGTVSALFFTSDPFKRVELVGLNAVSSDVMAAPGSQSWPFRELGREVVAERVTGEITEITMRGWSMESVWLQPWYENFQGRHFLQPVEVYRGPRLSFSYPENPEERESPADGHRGWLKRQR